MNGAMMIRWGANIPGREAVGLDVFNSAINRFETMTKEGRIHGHREFISLTGRDGGFALLEGEVEELTKILAEEDTLRLNAQASAVVEDFEVQTFAGGTDQAIQQLVGNYATSMRDLGYM
jgi:hypothetical protein